MEGLTMPQHDPAHRLEAELAAAVTTGVKPIDYAQPHVRAAAGDRRLAVASSSPSPGAADTPAATRKVSPASDRDRLSVMGPDTARALRELAESAADRVLLTASSFIEAANRDAETLATRIRQEGERQARDAEAFGQRTTAMWDTLADGAHKFLDVETPPNKPAA